MQNGYIRIGYKEVIDEVYGPPDDMRGRKRFEAFKGRQIERPVILVKGNTPYQDDMPYQIDISRYEVVNDPQAIGGRIAFWARNGTGLFVVNERGERDGREYDQIYHLAILNEEKVYLIAKKRDAYLKEIIEGEFFTE